MEQDVNKIIDTLNMEWAQDASLLRKRIAIITEENERLGMKVQELEAKLPAEEKTENAE